MYTPSLKVREIAVPAIFHKLVKYRRSLEAVIWQRQWTRTAKNEQIYAKSEDTTWDTNFTNNISPHTSPECVETQRLHLTVPLLAPRALHHVFRIVGNHTSLFYQEEIQTCIKRIRNPLPSPSRSQHISRRKSRLLHTLGVQMWSFFGISNRKTPLFIAFCKGNEF